MSQFAIPKQFIGLAGWIAISFAAAAVGAAASVRAGQFYDQLIRPDWAPPAWVFGPVWTVLYAVIGVAAWLVWREKGFRPALGIFFVQLAANALWSWLFFGWRWGGAAFVDILVLWGLIIAMLVAFWRVRPLAGALLIPYLGWVSFAAALNYSIWRLNPMILG